MGDTVDVTRAGNQSPIPFDTLDVINGNVYGGWESITNPL